MRKSCYSGEGERFERLQSRSYHPHLEDSPKLQKVEIRDSQICLLFSASTLVTIKIALCFRGRRQLMENSLRFEVTHATIIKGVVQVVNQSLELILHGLHTD